MKEEMFSIFPLSEHINMMRYFNMICKQVKIKITAFVTQRSVKHGYCSIANKIPTWYFWGVECMQDFRFEKR